MPRIARVVVEGYPHHITHRGNYQQKIFDMEEDYERYLHLVEKYRAKYSLSIIGYNLIPNHVHFIGVPENKKSLSMVFNVTQMVYSQSINKRRKVTGHLWHGRFYSSVMDTPYLYNALKYVETNAVRAGLVKNVLDWKWSSAREHLKGEKGIIKLADISKYLKIDDWEKYLKESIPKSTLDEIRKNTKTGRPLGSKEFVEKLEKKLDRKLTVLSKGRPKKRK